MSQQSWGNPSSRIASWGTEPAVPSPAQGPSGLCMCPQTSVSWPCLLNHLGHLTQQFSECGPTAAGSVPPGNMSAKPSLRPCPDSSNQMLWEWGQQSVLQQALQANLMHWKVWELLIDWRVTEVRDPTILRLPVKWILALSSFRLAQAHDSLWEKEPSDYEGKQDTENKGEWRGGHLVKQISVEFILAPFRTFFQGLLVLSTTHPSPKYVYVIATSHQCFKDLLFPL